MSKFNVEYDMAEMPIGNGERVQQPTVSQSPDPAATGNTDFITDFPSSKVAKYCSPPILVDLPCTSAEAMMRELNMSSVVCEPNVVANTAPLNIEMAEEESINNVSSSRRRMPTRASKINQISFLHHVQYGGIEKAKAKRKLPKKLTPKQVEALYKKQTLTNFHPTHLETIFEVPENDCEDDSSQQFELIGPRKIKRSLNLKNMNCKNKTLISKRRAKIKKVLPEKKRHKKISMDAFLKRFNADDETQGEAAADGEQRSNADDELSEENKSSDRSSPAEVDNCDVDENDEQRSNSDEECGQLAMDISLEYEAGKIILED